MTEGKDMMDPGNYNVQAPAGHECTWIRCLSVRYPTSGTM